jgi:hypothetical protein
MKNLGLSNVQESTGSVPAGGYICRILDVQDVPSKEYLMVKVDIAQGPHANHYKDLEERFGFWGLIWYMSYKSTALGMFKAGIKALRASNANFQWNDDTVNDERNMIGCFVGGVLAEEEYLSKDGTVKINVMFKTAVCTQTIIDGQFKVPEKKKLESHNMTAEVVDTTKGGGYTAQDGTHFAPVNEKDIPF